MRRLSIELQHALAAEYVLGTLRGRARRRFEALVRADRGLASIVRAWEDWLTPLAASIEPVEPPARVWKAIESRLAPRALSDRNGASRPRPAPSVWSSLAFWRAAGVMLAVALVAVLVFLPAPTPAPEAPSMVAVLSTPEQEPRMIVERHTDSVKVRWVKPWVKKPGVDYELWVVPKDGKPRSLGVVPAEGTGEIRLAQLEGKLQDGVAFAVSREPTGGSPTGAPTGPVVCSGAIARAQRA